MEQNINFINELFGNLYLPTKESMIDNYIKGIITKEQLDRYMEGIKNNGGK